MTSLLRKIRFSFAETATTKTVYMRKLPKQLISFSSSLGQRIFTEALYAGTMDVYFPLSEQFLTQYKPATCGATSLVMVLNALKVDPQAKWQGIWRWYSEENLSGIKTEHFTKGINLSDLSHIASHNRVSIQTFYHPDQLLIEELKKYQILKKLLTGIIVPKKTTTQWLPHSRHLSFVLMHHHDGKAFTLSQITAGIGHFCPIGGYHEKKQMVLLFDVARYKYPPQWCSIQLLYDSFAGIDNQTQMTRGFQLVSRSIDFPQLCRITEDHKSMSQIKKWYFDRPKMADKLPREVLRQLVIYLFTFLEREAHQNFTDNYLLLQSVTKLNSEEVYSLVQSQPELDNLLLDFSYRDQSQANYKALLIYNYLFSPEVLKRHHPLKVEFKFLHQVLGLHNK